MEINKVSDPNNSQQPQPKRQIRRRLHTSKPYQDSFQNMAEVRREIVTALKFHRASMKQQQAATNHGLQSPPPPELERPKPMGNTNYWPMSPLVPPPLLNQENLNLELPNQPLGLNLNIKHFNNINRSIYYNPPDSSTLSATKEVAVVNSARCCKTFEIGTVKDGKRGVSSHEDGDWCYDDPFEQVVEFPSWLINANYETSCSQNIFDQQLSHEYPPDPSILPCMDIDGIGGMDGEEWLA
ncbi:hypothetical protein M8C21_030237 [Ambrosia artemisiifolia]|uniref:Hydroxyproline-rich glycoprotein family protein n=1 Tax=Ambrosia artemisiifolia TaxID=4212 RepID=A0AAD5CRN6_AMBAR|nr:hypothetical protein M8C21_030237 [Ambrosia artemisiifolia]